MSLQWRVIGGAKGGIVVRTGPELKAPEASARLAKGALVEELAMQGDRLQYRIVDGEGPETGWVSLRFKGSDLLARPFDIIIYGCTGLAGHWACRWLQEVEGLRWCVAGREPGKVQQVADEFGKEGLLAADSEPASFERLAARTKVVLALAGPYRRPWGKMLAGACARHGTHWVDITGETSFVRECIDELHETAESNRCVLLHGCGAAEIFYTDLGMKLVLQHLRDKKGATARRVEVMSYYMGGASGGTLESGLSMREEVPRKILCDPWLLAQKSPGLVEQSWLENDDENWLNDAEDTAEHPVFGFVAPHSLANGNTRFLRRSLQSFALAKRHYGPEGHEAQIAVRLFCLVGSKEEGKQVERDNVGSWMKDPKGKMRARAFIEMGAIPKVGQGPSEEVSKAVRYLEYVVAESTDGQKAHCFMRCGLCNVGEACGYAGTGLCGAMAALCLALEGEQRSQNFGCLTPTYALEGTSIFDRAPVPGGAWWRVPCPACTMAELKVEAEDLLHISAFTLEHAEVESEQPPPVSVSTDASTKKRRRKKTAKSVFESTPAAPTADTGYSSARASECATSSIKSQTERNSASVADVRSIFESIPVESKADFAGGTSRPGPKRFEQSVFESAPSESHADTGHAAAAASSTKEPSTFESSPAQSMAEVSYSRSLLSTEGPSVFESSPAESGAAVGYGRSVLSAEEPATFESNPVESSAEVGYGRSVLCPEEPSTFESNPAESPAAVGYGKSMLSPEEPSTFESVPRQSCAEVGYGKSVLVAEEPASFESSPVESRAEVGHCRSVLHAQEPATFESSPAKSGAEAGYSRDLVPAQELSTFERSPAQSGAVVGCGRGVTSRQEPATFESSPSESGTEVGYGRSVPAAQGPSTFESTPVESSAEVGYGRGVVSTQEPSTFESSPIDSFAEVSHDRSVHSVEGPSTFESIPIESFAEVGHGRSAHSVTEPASFESNPAKSPAEVGYGWSVVTQQEQSTFESNPVKSSADVGHGRSVLSEREQSTFESNPTKSEAAVGYGRDTISLQEQSTFESTPTESRAAVGYGKTLPQLAEGCQSVFESQPSQSKAHAKAGVNVSEPESDTDSQGSD